MRDPSSWYEQTAQPSSDETDAVSLSKASLIAHVSWRNVKEAQYVFEYWGGAQHPNQAQSNSTQLRLRGSICRTPRQKGHRCQARHRSSSGIGPMGLQKEEGQEQFGFRDVPH